MQNIKKPKRVGVGKIRFIMNLNIHLEIYIWYSLEMSPSNRKDEKVNFFLNVIVTTRHGFG